MSVKDRQVGGDHYKNKKIEPIDYILANDMGFCEGNVVKYVTRWSDKNGLEDLNKCMHYLQFLIEAEQEKERKEKSVPMQQYLDFDPLV